MVTISIIAIQIGCLIIGRTPVPVVLQLSQLNKREAEYRDMLSTGAYCH
jgi:hypothetical protein